MSVLGRDLARWQLLTALAGVTAATLHLPVLGDHLAGATYMGLLFAGFVLANSALAAVLVLQPSRAAFAGAAVLNAAAIATYVATRLVAFPQLADDVGAWVELWGLLAVSAEAGTAVVGYGGWRALGRDHRRTAREDGLLAGGTPT